MKSSAAALCAVLVLILTPTAFAGGYEYGTDNGAESVARAGATTANPSFTALYTNVAGVADTRYVDFYLTSNFIFRHLMFQRAATGDQGWDPVEDEGTMDLGPALALHFRVADWLTLAIGARRPRAGPLWRGPAVAPRRLGPHPPRRPGRRGLPSRHDRAR